MSSATTRGGITRGMDRRSQAASPRTKKNSLTGVTGSAESGAACPGSRWTRSTCSRQPKASASLRNSSVRTANSWSITSCSPQVTTQGCTGCSLLADHLDGAIVHLEHHDVSVVLASRASRSDIAPYQSRMGWNAQWVSCGASDFNYDFQVSFTPEQIASGNVEYNYQTFKPWGETRTASACFSRTSATRCSTPISSYGRGMRAGAWRLRRPGQTPNGRAEHGEAAICSSGSSATMNTKKPSAAHACCG